MLVEPNCVVRSGGALGGGNPDVGDTLGIGNPDVEGCALGIVDPDVDARFDVVDIRKGDS